ncbi:MAG: MMPL family transporter [Pseudomonadota bacterium]
MRNLLSTRYHQLILGYPKVVLFLLFLLLIFFGLQARDFKLDASADSLLLENDQDLRLYREVSKRYATQEFLFVTFTPNNDLFSDAVLQVIARLRDELKQLERVDSVVSLVDVPLVRNVDTSLSELADNIRTLEDDRVDKVRAREELLHSPIFRELIISADAKTTALQINLKENERYSQLSTKRAELLNKKAAGTLNEEQRLQLEQVQADYTAIKHELDEYRHQDILSIRDIIAPYREHGELHLGGVPMVADDMISFVKNDLIVFGVGVFFFLIVVLGVIFRRLRWIILPLSSCIYAGLIMMGVLGFVGWPVTVISSNFISLMLIITMSMNIHLIVHYRLLCRDHPQASQRELVSLTARKMVWPCLYTSLTTIIAFSSLVVSGIKPVIDFGWMMTLGLTVTFLTSFLLFPSALMLLPRSPAGDSTELRLRFTTGLAAITDRHGGKVLGISALLAVLSLIGIYQLRVENSFINYFSSGTEIYQGMKLIDEQLGGTTPLDVVVKLADKPEPVVELENPGVADPDDDLDALDDLLEDVEVNKADYWFTPSRIEEIKRYHDYFEGLPAVGKVLSLASITRVAEQFNDGQPFSGLELAVIIKRMPDLLKRTMINPYISVEHDEARINLRVLDSLKDLRRKELLDRIRTDLATNMGAEPRQTQLSGLLVLYNNMLQNLFRSQILTLGVVMLGIAVMLLVLFRSFTLAIIGIIPNLLSALAILGLMGLLQIPLDMMTITIAAITIGIAVDDTIHYIYRFREEYSTRQDYLETLYYCHAHVGTAVFYTSITIILGFSILVLSNFIPTIYFGLFTALAMVIALLAALTLLPKLIVVWKPFS